MKNPFARAVRADRADQRLRGATAAHAGFHHGRDPATAADAG